MRARFGENDVSVHGVGPLGGVSEVVVGVVAIASLDPSQKMPRAIDGTETSAAAVSASTLASFARYAPASSSERSNLRLPNMSRTYARASSEVANASNSHVSMRPQSRPKGELDAQRRSSLHRRRHRLHARASGDAPVSIEAQDPRDVIVSV